MTPYDRKALEERASQHAEGFCEKCFYSDNGCAMWRRWMDKLKAHS